MVPRVGWPTMPQTKAKLSTHCTGTRDCLRWIQTMSEQESAVAHGKFAPVILAGGSGTRFWPRSRRARAKQVLALDGDRTMIQQTLDRLLSLAAPEDVWVITNDLLKDVIAEQLPQVPQ